MSLLVYLFQIKPPLKTNQTEVCLDKPLTQETSIKETQSIIQVSWRVIERLNKCQLSNCVLNNCAKC